GLGASWVAIPLAANMLVATWTQKFKLGAPFQGGEVQGYELDVLMVLGCVALILLGAGPLSIDGAIN
ncbi:MAG: DoxX family protein, partial [Dehalococcoidia bacterium]